MIKKILVFPFRLSVVFIMSFFMCSCEDYWCRKQGTYVEKYCVFKFPDGEDYSQYYVIFDHFKLQPSVKPDICRPIRLHNGYYLSNSRTYDASSWTYLNFTYDELEAGLVPDDWNNHCQDYVLVDCPYDEYYSVVYQGCRSWGLETVPGYCPQCTQTYGVDTAWLNAAIDNGDFFVLQTVHRRK